MTDPHTGARPVQTLSARMLDARGRDEVLEVVRRAVARDDLTLGLALRVLRAAYLRVSRDRFAQMTGVSPRALAKLEADGGNPTLETLARVFRPFGFQVGLIPRRGTALGEAPPVVDGARYEQILGAVRAAADRRGRS